MEAKDRKRKKKKKEKLIRIEPLTINFKRRGEMVKKILTDADPHKSNCLTTKPKRDYLSCSIL